jgi:hypothetical protein
MKAPGGGYWHLRGCPDSKLGLVIAQRHLRPDACDGR